MIDFFKPLRKCPIELPNDERSVATKDHSSNKAGYKKKPRISARLTLNKILLPELSIQYGKY